MPTETQLSDANLRAHIARLIDQGRLPLEVSADIAAGYGSEHKCDACAEPITRTQIEYEVASDRHGVSLHLHFGCHVLWQLECVKRIRGLSHSYSSPPAR